MPPPAPPAPRRRLAYGLALAGFGLAFPVVATLLDAWFIAGSLAPHELVAAQRGTPLLWIIDSAPLVLGVLGWRLGIARDRRVQLAAELRHTLEYRTAELAAATEDSDRLLRWMSDGIVVTDQGGRIERVNPAACRLLGRTEGELLGTSFVDYVAEGPATVARVMNDSTAQHRVTLHGPGQRREVSVELACSIMHDANGGARGHVFVAHDLRAQLAVERRLTSILSNLPNFVVIASTDGVIEKTNHVEDEHHQEVVGGRLWTFVPREQRALVRSACRRAIETMRTVEFETVVYDDRGGARYFRNCVGPIRDQDDITGLIMIKRDVSPEKEAARAQRRLASAVEQASDSVMITDPLGAIVYVNPAFTRVSGYAADEVIGRSPGVLKSGRQPREVYDELWNTIGRGEVWTGRLENRAKDGEHFIEDVRITPIVDGHGRIEYFLAVKHDVTEQLVLETQRALGQKMESIGQLAAGIAHEINTPTQYVSDNTSFLQRAFDKVMSAVDASQAVIDHAAAGTLDDAALKDARKVFRRAKLEFLRGEVPKAIEQSLEGLGRVSKIVGAMKEFSHPSGGAKEHVDLAHALETTLTVARNEWKYVANLVTEFDADMPPVPCLRDELNQVLLNIIVNASHAISDVTNGGADGLGTITVGIRHEDDNAVITIGDTGGGMPPEVQRRIFDPFFTTKAVGKGTGQGLAIAHSVVVDKHDGTIEVDSEVGVGTTFTIRLPLSIAATAETQEDRHASALR